MNPPFHKNSILGATEMEVNGQCYLIAERRHSCSSLKVTIDCDLFPEDDIPWGITHMLNKCFSFTFRFQWDS